MIVDDLEAAFVDAGVTGFVHAREIGPGASAPEVDLRAEERVVLASVFKIVVSVAYHRAVAAGLIDPAARRLVDAFYRRGGNGVGGFRFDVDVALGDLAELMMTVSDNAATDVVIDAVGLAEVRRVLDDLGMRASAISGRTLDDAELEERELRALVAPGLDPERADPWHGVPNDLLLTLSTLDPATSRTYSTPREVTHLLEEIWCGRAASPGACAEVRATMERQVAPHRLSSGFDSSYAVAGKTGTLEGIRNEAGVVTTPAGRQVAVAVFTRSADASTRIPRHDAVIGRVARLCVDHLCPPR